MTKRTIRSAFDHPDLEWTPCLTWGDPIPLIWRRVANGLWFVWPPRQFQTSEPDGLNVWRSSYATDSYKPDRPCQITPADAGPLQSDFENDRPIVWGGSISGRWGAYPDGRTLVHFARFEVHLPPAKVVFRAYDLRDGNGGYFTPKFIWHPPIIPPTEWASCRSGPLSLPTTDERLWFYPTPEGRRWVARILIEPTDITVEKLPELPPIDLPSPAEVEAEEAHLRQPHEILGDLADRAPSRMLCDLAGSHELMTLVGNDEFAAEFQVFVRQNEFVHTETGQIVRFNTDDTGAVMLSILRRYGEDWHDCEMYPPNGEQKHLPTLERLFLEIGYAVFDPPIDEEAHKQRLIDIWRSMPTALKAKVFEHGRPPNPLILAWAMGHFWQEDRGWNDPADFAAEGLRSMQGGHIPAAFEIAKLFESGEIVIGDPDRQTF